MGFDDGRIILDSANGAYYAGQTVHGRVVFNQGKPKTIHGIYVSFKGFCKVHWTTRKTRRVNNRTEHKIVSHDAYEEYFNNKCFLVGSSEGEYNLNAGSHEFSFEYTLPGSIPSSFEDEVGHIRYRVKVVMLTCGIFSSNKEKMAALRVIVPVNLNLIPYCKDPIEYEIIATYCCWCINSGSTEIRVKLPVGGYCPGQIIPLEVSVINLSGVEIDELKFAIKKDTKFVATDRPATKKRHSTVLEAKKGPIPAGTSRNWNFDMEVPTLDVYNFDTCRFIDIEYSFKVSTEVSGCHEDSDESHPIIFGHVPLVGFQDNILNPLRDQMPYPTPGENAPIMNQPLPSAYPNGNYPQNTPYPGPAPYPHPPNVPPYPYPENQPYPNVTPYPNPSYPNVSPYPTSPPNPMGNLSQPTPVPAFPGNANAPPYPSNDPAPPYPGPNPNISSLKTGTIGFTGTSGDADDSCKAPLLPPGADVPPYPASSPPNPFATASAPAPATPATPAVDLEYPPAFNPDFVDGEKKEEKKN